MPRTFLRARTRQRLVVFIASVLGLGGIAFAQGQAVSAAETTVQYPVSCTTLGDLNVTIISSSDPETATAGGAISFNTAASLPPQTLSIAVTRATLTFPVPAQVQVTDVMFMGGNLTGSWRNSPASSLVLTFTGNTPLSDLRLPALMIMGQVRAGTAGQTIQWGGPTAMTVTTSLLGVSCTGDGRALATTPIAGAPTTTSTTSTTRATTTSTSTTSTTRATTTSTTSTTRATTTSTTSTTRATTTSSTSTTRATTSTSPTTTVPSSTTSTTVAEPTTTTTTVSPPGTRPPISFREYFRQVLCRLWRLSCTARL